MLGEVGPVTESVAERAQPSLVASVLSLALWIAVRPRFGFGWGLRFGCGFFRIDQMALLDVFFARVTPDTLTFVCLQGRFARIFFLAEWASPLKKKCILHS